MFPLPAIVSLLAGAATLIACAGGSGPKDSGTGTGEPGLRFLLASDKGLSEFSDGKERSLVNFKDGSFLLDPIVSPDGKQLAFVRQEPATIKAIDGSVDFGSDLYVSQRDGSKEQLVLRHQAVAEFLRRPAWLADGSLLVAVHGRNAQGLSDRRIDAVDPRTGRRNRLIENAVDPAVGPDGASLLYLSIEPLSEAEELTVSSVTNLAQKQVLAGTRQGLALISSAVWSPDGTKVAFAAVDLNAPGSTLVPGRPNAAALAHPFAQDIWVVNRDGSDLRRLIELSDNQPSLDWSADGASIYALGATGFWRIEIATGRREQVGLGAPLGHIHLLKP
jgi:Tol biopolymer transport system component